MVATSYQGATQPLRRQHDRKVVRIARRSLTTLFIAVVVVNLGASLSDTARLPLSHLAAAGLAAYMLIEIRRYLQRSDTFGLLSPAFLALFFHFGLNILLGITASTFEASIMGRFGYWLPNPDGTLAKTLLLAGLAVFCMLRGYAFGQPVARKVWRSVSSSRVFRRHLRSSVPLMFAIQVAYLGVAAVSIRLGVFGLLSTAETLSKHADVVQFLNLALAAGKLSYFLITLHYFRLHQHGRASPLFGVLVSVLIALHIFTGALSGFKSQVVFPFVLAGLAFFVATHRVPTRFVAFAVVAIIAAYSVIEPFRVYLGQRDQPPASVLEAVTGLSTAVTKGDELTRHNKKSRAQEIAQRFDLLGMSALAIDYVDRGKLSDGKRREFQLSIVLAPLLAYVPRAIWPGKPIYASDGLWFNQTVLGFRSDTRTSVGMGPMGYLYMVGGILALAAGFLGFGMLQAIIFNGVARAGVGGLIVFFSVSGTLIQIPSSFGPALTGILRMLPFAVLAQLLLLRGHSIGQPNYRALSARKV